MNALLGIKQNQSQQFTDLGKRIPVTTLTVGPCWVSAVVDRGTYRSVQLGFGNTKYINRAQEGHIKKAGLDKKPRFLREFRLPSGESDIKPGTEVLVGDVFAAGDRIRITGVSKGKGFAGGVKRHGFSGGPRTHGQSDRERAPGSIGSGTTPGRVNRGKRMAGRMGTDRVTVHGLRVVSVHPDTHTLVIKGLVPGAARGLLLIQKGR